MDAELGQLDALEANLRAFDRVGVDIARDALAGVERAARETASAGTDPSGKPWAKTKDGRGALPNAASEIHAVLSGATQAVIVLVMKGAYRFHQGSKNKSEKKGLPRRVILPTADTGVPSGIREALAASVARVVGRKLGGAR